jgi:hypothetical protein
MRLQEYRDEIDTVQAYGMRALGFIPARSFYRLWVSQLIDGTLPLPKYPRLKARLERFWGDEMGGCGSGSKRT